MTRSRPPEERAAARLAEQQVSLVINLCGPPDLLDASHVAAAHPAATVEPGPEVEPAPRRVRPDRPATVDHLAAAMCQHQMNLVLHLSGSLDALDADHLLALGQPTPTVSPGPVVEEGRSTRRPEPTLDEVVAAALAKQQMDVVVHMCSGVDVLDVDHLMAAPPVLPSDPTRRR